MAEKTQPKIPLPALLVTARPAKQAKKRKPEAEKAATKKALDKARGQTRVNIGAAFEGWRKLRELKGPKSNAEVAVFLLDSYEKDQSTSTPSKHRLMRPPPPPVSTIVSETLSDRYETTGREPSTYTPCSTPSKPRRKRRRVNPPARSSIAGSLSPLRENQPWASGEDTLSASEVEESLQDMSAQDNPQSVLTVDADIEEKSIERGRCRPMEVKRERIEEEASIKVEVTIKEEDAEMTWRSSIAGSTEGSQHAEEEQEEEEEEGVQEEEETITNLKTTEIGESNTSGGMCVQEIEPEMEMDQVTTELPQSQEDCQLPGEEEREADSPDVHTASPDVHTDNSYIPSPTRASPGCPSYSSDIATSGKPIREIMKDPDSPLSDSTVIQRKAVQPAQTRASARISKKENKRIDHGDNSGPDELSDQEYNHGSSDEDYVPPLCKRSTVPKRLGDDDISRISEKRKREETIRAVYPCEFGCGKIFSFKPHLNRHMKYQHIHQKSFKCSEPSCGKSFNWKMRLKEHEKQHSNQRDFICEICTRAFRNSSNLIIHRRIHTGEKPLQCEVCGYTCRQKASLNWHMRKHDAESGYQFPCEICGRRFEKKDNVTVHRSKSHPDHTPSPAPSLTTNPASPISETPSPPLERPDDPSDPSPGPAPSLTTNPASPISETPSPLLERPDDPSDPSPGPAPSLTTNPASPISETPSPLLERSDDPSDPSPAPVLTTNPAV